ncbi:DNA polymerase III subunit delta [Rhizosaccharibacter radicis]|uniref:DNA-directed DNA polymerase n=1 Tax=Rhizosaccharibacter radicis TaxID=2782605 RepID=A0ABT1VSF6_9PROT|nr:DNA polymerase III subunit delta [Acetobacteraceae bacterium KSS12]
MKIDARQANRVLAAPGAMRALLLFGEDAGLIRERALLATRAVAGSLDDPFRVATLGRDAHDRLEEEIGALSLTGGRRVVWVREATDTVTAPLQRALGRPNTDCLVVLEAPGLASRSKLRALVEAMPDGGALGCYPEEGRALESSLSAMLAEQKVRIDADALGWLAARLGADRAAARGEVEKLVLYAGEEGRLTLDDVRDCTGDAAGASLEDAAFAATAGDRAATDLAIERALADGSSPVAVARVLLGHLHRLRQARLLMEDGMAPADAMRTLRPPVFFKRTADFSRALSLWSAQALARATDSALALEKSCKQGGAPELLCRRHLAVLAATARAAASRTGRRDGR